MERPLRMLTRAKLINCTSWLRIWAWKVIKLKISRAFFRVEWPIGVIGFELLFFLSPSFSSIVHNEKRLKFMHINKPLQAFFLFFSLPQTFAFSYFFQNELCRSNDDDKTKCGGWPGVRNFNLFLFFRDLLWD